MRLFPSSVASGFSRTWVILLALLAGGCNVQVGGDGLSIGVGSSARDEWTRTYTLPAGGELDIVNVNGRITATPAEGRQVEVRVEREARGGSEEEAQALMKSVEMREEVTANRVRIEARADVSGFGRRGFSATYTLRIPAGLVVSVKTENGGIRFDNVSGRITATTTNGGIDGHGIVGSINAEVVNGGVDISMAEVTGDINLTAVNGAIQIQIPADTGASLEATCVNGAINVDDAFSLQASESSRRRVSGTINGGGSRIVTSTVNGGVRIRQTQSGPG